MSPPKRIPPRHELGTFFFFSLEDIDKVNIEHLKYLSRLFKQANAVINLFLTCREFYETTLFFSVARALVSELHILRYGIRKSLNRLSPLDERARVYLSDANTVFDQRFLNVAGLRNIIQHHGEYEFGDAKTAHVKRSELTRLGLPITIAPGGSIRRMVQFYFNESPLISSHFNGDLCEVYIGDQLPMMVGEILALICAGASSAAGTKISLDSGLNEIEVRQRSDQINFRS